MDDLCHQCRMKFNETSLQFYRRMKKNGPKICRDCYRINNAEERERLRKSSSCQTHQDPLQSRINSLKKEHGSLSIPLLMNKLRISYEHAFQILNKK